MNEKGDRVRSPFVMSEYVVIFLPNGEYYNDVNNYHYILNHLHTV